MYLLFFIKILPISFLKWHFVSISDLWRLTKLVFTQAVISRGFGLVLPLTVIEYECYVIFNFVDTYGGLSKIKTFFTFEKTQENFWEFSKEPLEWLRRFYFEQEKNDQVKSKYACHVAAVKTALLSEIYYKERS